MMEMVSPALESRERLPETVIGTVVLHATATETAEEALTILRERGLSYHFLIDRDGATLQLVDPARVAFHAGESFGPQGPAANETSIGISFVNKNDGQDPFTDEQENSARDLILTLMDQFSDLKWVTSHAIIAPTRKNDPLGYDLESLAHDIGLVLWRDQTASPK